MIKVLGLVAFLFIAIIVTLAINHVLWPRSLTGAFFTGVFFGSLAGWLWVKAFIL
jgi:hypothetical protein